MKNHLLYQHFCPFRKGLSGGISHSAKGSSEQHSLSEIYEKEQTHIMFPMCHVLCQTFQLCCDMLTSHNRTLLQELLASPFHEQKVASVLNSLTYKSTDNFGDLNMLPDLNESLEHRARARGI